MLKAGFPVDVRSTKATYDIQYDHVERPTHFNTSWDYARFEVVAHKWADLSEQGYGVALLNNCKYGHSVKDNVMHITLLKSGKNPGTECDMGHHEFTYALLPHAGSVAESDVIEESVKLNLPVRAAANMAGDAFSTFLSSSDHVYFDAIKKAEDGDELVLRVHECRGGQADVELTPGFAMASYQRCNLLEEPQGEPVEASTIRLHLRPFEIATCKLSLHPDAAAQ